MHLSLSIYIYIYTHVILCIIYIYICICVCVCVYIYIYIYHNNLGVGCFSCGPQAPETDAAHDAVVVEVVPPGWWREHMYKLEHNDIM